MKKVLSFVLVLSMILGSFGMAFAAAPSDVAGMSCEDAVNVLIELGVVEGYKDGSYRPEKTVTRAEAATLIIKALGLNDYAVGKSSFTDMAGHWADPYVAYAVSLEFIAGYGDNTFRPDEIVTYDQLITMVVQALGYKADYLVGGYPGAFVAQAKTLGLLKDIKSGVEGANRGDVAIMLFNTLPARFVRYNNEGTLQNIALRYEGDAAVYDTMLQRLGAEAYNDGDAFVVTGAEPAVINMKQYQGAYVTAYMNSDEDIIAVEEVKSVYLAGEWNTADAEFETEDVTYDVDKATYGDNNAAPVEFVNGKIGDVEAEDLEDVVIAAKVSGKKIKEIYSVSVWKDGVTVMWDEDLAEELAEDDTLDGEDFEMTDNKEIDTEEFALMGVASLEEIEEDAIVTYYVNGKVTKVEVSTDVVEGKITKTKGSVEGDDYEVYIAGKYYDVVDLVGESDTVALGDEGKFFLNYAGDIVHSDVVSAEAKDYAVVLESADGASGLNGKDAKVKLFLADGTDKVFVIDKDAFYAGTGEEDGDIIAAGVDMTEVEENLTAGLVVKYSVNKDGEIDKMEAVTGFVNVAAADEKAITEKGTFDGKKLASNVVIFTAEDLSANSDDADDYGVVVRDKVLGQKDVAAKYVLDNGEIVFMMMEMDGTTGTHVFAVVTGCATLEDDLYEITMLVDGAEKTYTSEEQLNDKTTIYAIDFDGNGYATNVKADLDAEDFAEIEVDAIVTGGSITKLTANKLYTGDKEFAITLDADVVVYKWDAEKSVFKAGKVSDIKGYDYGVEFYDVDADQVADIVLLVAAE